ncbi:MAG: S1 RNA-binding domain-containing protein [Chloroflexi bacterium]|nr:S1 RNA-binding domain-containing protein [Chloroflexota bacterium]
MTTPTSSEMEVEQVVEVTEAAEEVVAVVEDDVELDLDALIDLYTPAKNLRRGEIIDGKVLSKTSDALVVNIGYKAEGIVPMREARSIDAETLEALGVGDEVIAYVINPENEYGAPVLSIDRARGEQGWRILEKSMEIEETVKGKIIGSNRGGAVVEAEGVQGFVPLSQLVGPARELYVPGGEEPKEGFVGMEIEFKVIELNRLRNRAIFSERAALQAWKATQKARLVKELTEGETRKGRVTGISSFGAFVDLGGADGLIHISELSWEPVKSPEDIVKVGQELQVFVLRVDRETLKIALSLRRLQPEPWETVHENFAVAQVLDATVTKLANFGAFARLEGGIEGLIHISELSEETIEHPRDVVSEGQSIQVRILRIEPERRRLGLSIKQVPEESYRPEELDGETVDVQEFAQIFNNEE